MRRPSGNMRCAPLPFAGRAQCAFLVPRCEATKVAAAVVTVSAMVVLGAASPDVARHWVYVDALGAGGANTAAADRDNDGWFDISGNIHEAAIEAIAAAGISGGFSDGTFRPNAPVTRGQMATFLVRATAAPP